MNRRAFLAQTALLLPAMTLRLPVARRAWEGDEEICRRKFELAVSMTLQEQPFGNVITAMGRSFLGTGYVAHALEVPGEERLVVNMRGLDCVSFYENALVLARCIKKNTLTFDDYKNELQWIRYRGGVINGYPSRLHYTSDYFYDNVQKGVWKNITEELGGIPFLKTINYMSTHPDQYRQLKERPELIPIIRKQEEAIMGRKNFFVPKDRVAAIQDRLQNGDILGMTTDYEGLDTSHTGIVMREEGVTRLLHAPLAAKEVVISDGDLAHYLAANKRQTGIMVVRPIDPTGEAGK